MRRFIPLIRYTALSIIAIGTLAFILGVVLQRAAVITKADSDYTVAVSWVSAIRAVLWPPNELPLAGLVSILVLAGLTVLVFFRAPRGLSVAMLFLEAAIAYFFGGGEGLFFLRREVERYHFNMDAEKLGEHWFIYESIGLWTIITVLLGFLRLFGGKQAAKSSDETLVAPLDAPK